jgi:hypothetical protein
MNESAEPDGPSSTIPRAVAGHVSTQNVHTGRPISSPVASAQGAEATRRWLPAFAAGKRSQYAMVSAARAGSVTRLPGSNLSGDRLNAGAIDIGTNAKVQGYVKSASVKTPGVIPEMSMATSDPTNFMPPPPPYGTQGAFWAEITAGGTNFTAP